MAKIEIYTKAFCPYCTRAKALLDGKGADFQEIDVTMDRAGHEAMHDGGVLTLDEVRLPAAAAEEVLQLLMGDAGEERGICDLIAVEVQDREHCAVGLGVDELVEVP